MNKNATFNMLTKVHKRLELQNHIQTILWTLCAESAGFSKIWLALFTNMPSVAYLQGMLPETAGNWSGKNRLSAGNFFLKSSCTGWSVFELYLQLIKG